MNEPTIKIRYNGVDVEYDEARNLWCFNLRGSDKTSMSLELAKKVIDKPTPKGKGTFKSFFVWRMELLGGDAQKLEVVGTADPGKYGYGKYVWVKDLKGKRSKERFRDMFESNPPNDIIIHEIHKLNAQLEQIQEKQGTLRNKLAEAKYPEGVE